MILAARAANSKGLPIVLDPVGIGATRYRTQEVCRILTHSKIAIIRGNASEIAYLSDNTGAIKGVDSLLKASDCLEQAKSLAVKYQCIVWMSGKTDVVTDGQMTDHAYSNLKEFLNIVVQSIEGGVTVVQLRAKEASTQALIALGEALLAILHPLGIPLIINDRVDIAHAISADGVHLGQSDLNVSAARAILGPKPIIGISVETLA